MTDARTRAIPAAHPRARVANAVRAAVANSREGKISDDVSKRRVCTRTGRLVRNLLDHALGHDEVRHLVDQTPQRGRAVSLLVLVRQRPGLAQAHAPIAGSLGGGVVG